MRRRFRNGAYAAFVFSAAAVSGGVLLWLLATLAWKGARVVDLGFVLTASRDFGAAGGVLYQLTGSLLLVGCTALLCFPVALGAAIFNSEYLKDARSRRVCSLLVYGLNGVPSIIFGIFGLVLFVNVLGMGISWISGSLVLAMMILPTVVLATSGAIGAVPASYRENALALGLDQWQVVVRVLLPQGLAGAVTGLFLGLARAVGETAPILFIATAFSGVTVPASFGEPVASLPTHILALAQQAVDPSASRNAWGAAWVLMMLVGLFGAAGLWSRVKLTRIALR